MRIILELNDFGHGTLRSQFGDQRYLRATVGGKDFLVMHERDCLGRPDRDEQIDRFLVERMNKMLEVVFERAASAVPFGIDLLTDPSWYFEFRDNKGSEGS